MCDTVSTTCNIRYTTRNLQHLQIIQERWDILWRQWTSNETNPSEHWSNEKYYLVTVIAKLN